MLTSLRFNWLLKDMLDPSPPALYNDCVCLLDLLERSRICKRRLAEEEGKILQVYVTHFRISPNADLVASEAATNTWDSRG